jgi:folate-binding protein YgfZ
MTMPAVILEDRCLIEIAGAEAEHFLQNIVTTDIESMPANVAKPGALLTPQGKILFDFLILRTGASSFGLDCRADIGDDFVKRLMLYRLRAKVEINKRDQTVVAVSWEDDSAPSRTDSTASETDSMSVRDLRFPEQEVVRQYGSLPQSSASREEWDSLRIANGVAESGTDYALGDAFPHDVLLDQIDGVGFKKGCYVGQEVVSRMQHRGTARRRVLIVEGDGDLSTGAEITSAGKPLGVLGSAVGRAALAIVRIDKVKAAMDAGEPVTANGTALSFAIPAWAKVTFPSDTAAEDA